MGINFNPLGFKPSDDDEADSEKNIENSNEDKPEDDLVAQD